MHYSYIRRITLLCTALLFVSSLQAMPKFSARTGETCQSCHVNPTGKGMRSLSGASYGRDNLPMTTWSESTGIEDLLANLPKNFSVGADFRTLYMYNGIDKTGSFFQMEGNLYFDLRLNKKVRIYASKGLYSGFEAFGLAKVLPLEGYVKVGKFLPAYGMRIDDHNAFIRGGRYSLAFASAIPQGYPGGLRFGERGEDTGIELGFAPSIFTINAGVFNGTPGGGLTGVVGSKNYAVVLRGEAMLPTETVNATIGGSFYNHPNPFSPGKTQFYGAFGSLGIMKNLTLIGEVDWAVSTVAGKEVTGRMLYSELDFEIMQGLDFIGGYEFYDPDLKLENGSVSTITIGASVIPLSGVEVRPLYRLNKETPTELTNNEFQFLFHFFL